jgi:hypothetical protein
MLGQKHPRIMASKRPSVVASGLLARPGAAPTRTTPVEDLPRPPSPAAANTTPATLLTTKGKGGIKSATIGTTIYLLPSEHKRIRRLVLDFDVPSVHELLLMGLDRLLAERGEPPVRRYAPPRPRKG